LKMRPYTAANNKSTELRIIFKIFSSMRKELGSLRALMFMVDFSKEQIRVVNRKFNCIKGGDKKVNRQLRYGVSLQAAFYITLNKYLPEDKVWKYYEEMVEVAGVASLRRYMSPALDNKDAFARLKSLFQKTSEENKKAGIQDYEIYASNDDDFQLNVTTCLFYEMLKELGIPESCHAACHCDHVFFDEYLKDAGIEFSRKYTLAKGDKFCDFCFKRMR